MKWLRQGDVILKKVSKTMGERKRVGDSILAWGEVSGHKHVLKGQALELVSKDKRFVELERPAELVHEEHDTVQVPKGKYEVMIQREVDLVGEVRQVMD